jgi:hypothetical protein
VRNASNGANWTVKVGPSGFLLSRIEARPWLISTQLPPVPLKLDLRQPTSTQSPPVPLKLDFCQLTSTQSPLSALKLDLRQRTSTQLPTAPLKLDLRQSMIAPLSAPI